MNLRLPIDATPDIGASWLRQLVRDFGLGFHPDIAPEDYTLPSGMKCFTSDQCDLLTASLERVFEILGDDLPYEICAGEASAMLAELRGIKPPLEFHDRNFQEQLLSNGTREELIAWLCWNDPNGTYTDRDSEIEDVEILPLEKARDIMLEQISR